MNSLLASVVGDAGMTELDECRVIEILERK